MVQVLQRLNESIESRRIANAGDDATKFAAEPNLTSDALALRKKNQEKRQQLTLELFDIHSNLEVGYDLVVYIFCNRLIDEMLGDYARLEHDLKSDKESIKEACETIEATTAKKLSTAVDESQQTSALHNRFFPEAHKTFEKLKEKQKLHDDVRRLGNGVRAGKGGDGAVGEIRHEQGGWNKSGTSSGPRIISARSSARLMPSHLDGSTPIGMYDRKALAYGSSGSFSRSRGSMFASASSKSTASDESSSCTRPHASMLTARHALACSRSVAYAGMPRTVRRTSSNPAARSDVASDLSSVITATP